MTRKKQRSSRRPNHGRAARQNALREAARRESTNEPLGRCRRGFFGGPLPIVDSLTALEVRRRGQPLDDLIQLAADLDGRLLRVTPELPAFVFTELARATKTARGGALLASQGYGPQGVVLGRTLFESLLYIRWALGNPTDVDRLVRLHMRWAATVEADAWKESGIATFDSAPNPPLTHEERAEAIALFGPRGTQNWTGHRRIADLVRDVLALETENGTLTRLGRLIDEGFRLMLGWADRMVHTTGISTTTSVSSPRDDTDVGDIVMGPSRDHVQQSLMLLGASFAAILDLVLPRIAPDLVEVLHAVSARMWRSYRPVEQLSALSGDEPCPCDHPEGKWAQCHAVTDASADLGLERRTLAAIKRAKSGEAIAPPM